MVTILGVFLNNFGAHEALIQLPVHMKLDPPLCGWVNPMLEARIRGGRQAQYLKAVPVEVLLLLVDEPPERGSVVMADVQHNIGVILLS
jgi:hypothetical protein